MHGLYLKAAIVSSILALTSCSVTPEPSNTSAKPDAAASASASQEPVSGKTAFWEMYKSAHTWAADLVPLALESKVVPGMKNAAGKAAMWSATFGSPSKHEARSFTYCVMGHPPDIYKGVTVGNSRPWGGPVPTALPFDTSDFSVDSDAAYATAAAQANSWVSKNPGKEVSLTLGNASRFPAPVWYVLWGDNKKSGYAVYVNAKSGAVEK
jgi:hypothetical protein